MAIGISGTNNDVFSTEISVGPAGIVHYKYQNALIDMTNTSNYYIILSGCFDPANRKCYSGGGTSATDFVSGVNYTITGNADTDTVYKSDNVGIIEITGGGYIKSDVGYKIPQFTTISGVNEPVFTTNFWFWPATGPTQETAILQFRKYEGGAYGSGWAITMGRNRFNSTTIRRLSFYVYNNSGQVISVGTPIGQTSTETPMLLDEWNNIFYRESTYDNGFTISYQGDLVVKNRINRTPSLPSSFIGANSAAIIIGGNSNEYSLTGFREFTIGKADGITGTFRGKIGCLKNYDGLLTNSQWYPEEEGPPNPSAGNYYALDSIYYSLAPRYDQYD